MRIACVGRAAAQRVAVQEFVDRAFEQCRAAVGHLTFAQTYPASKEEVLVNSPPDVVVVGSSLPIEEAYAFCRDLRTVHANLPVLVFLLPENYSLRTLRRFEKVCSEAFSMEDPPIRVVHRLTSFAAKISAVKAGKLVTISGVKGGVGSTSVVSGLAHAAQALGKTAVVIDLSLAGAFSYYVGAQHWQSSDYAAAISDGIMPDKALVERCLTTAPNGITTLLQPSGGSDMRELWLRDSSRFEVTLCIVDLLLEIFDVVLVDLAGAEGVLQFALNCRASSRLLVSSTDSASVHLLSKALCCAVDIPGSSRNQILINNLGEGGLLHEDVLDFLYCCDQFDEKMVKLKALPFDKQGRHWIGSGNSFYTESSRAVQLILEDVLCDLLGERNSTTRTNGGKISLIAKLGSIAYRSNLAKRLEGGRKALPLLSRQIKEETTPQILRPLSSQYVAAGLLAEKENYDEIEDPPGMNMESAAITGMANRSSDTKVDSSLVYEPPQLQEPQ
jgi:MinD-like ATPase involved in chromosome partitioning or flagellar assembly